MNSPAINICYADHAQKRAAWLSTVLPHLMRLPTLALQYSNQVDALAEWLAPVGLDLAPRPATLAGLLTLHELARSGEYVPVRINCDVVAWPAQTIAAGGKCTDWLVVIAAVLTAWRVAWRVATAGDDVDPFRHVWIQAGAPGGWVDMDAKGNQAGLDFGQRVQGPTVVQFWEPR